MGRMADSAELLISTHAPAGGATSYFQGVTASRLISTHAPAGGATKDQFGMDASLSISTHAPAGGATYEHKQHRRAENISTHAPAGGATKLFISQPMKEKFLLTPLREGRRILLYFIVEQQHFYSRPCGRGDACGFLLRRSRPCISTHAPAGGATAKAWAVVDELMISTHAPAGGATRKGHSI